MEMQNRSVFRGQVTKLTKAASEYLESPEAQISPENKDNFMEIEEEIIVLVQRISSAAESLSKANSEVRRVQNFKSDELQKELENCCEYEDKAFSAITRLNHRLNKIRDSLGGQLQQEEPRPRAESSHHLKLPRLELRKFNGDHKDWLPFWEQFRTAVHENANLSGSDKFNYLLTALSGKAKETVTGFTPTQNCYDAAISLLQEEYGDTERIIDRNMQNLVSLPSVSQKSDVAGLRRLYNTVISITRSLTALGVPSSHYYVMLKTVLLKCMPTELRIEFHRSYISGNSDVNNTDTETSSSSSITFEGDKQVKMLLKFLKKEIDSLDRSNLGARCSNETAKVMHTAASLFTTEKKVENNCFFCNSETHCTKECNSNQSVGQRKNLLKRDRRCYRCTQKGHCSKDCRAKNLRCASCSGRHVTPVCEKNNSIITQKQIPIIQAQETNEKKRVEQSANVCSISAPLRIYLQTARALLFKSPHSSEKLFVRLLIDGGSQRTYIKRSVSRKMHLPVVGSQTIKISTFGGRKPEQSCNLVRFSLRSQFGDEVVSMIALEVEEICDDVLVEPARADINGLEIDLADSNTLNLPQEPGISLLVGSDNYWGIVSDEKEHLSQNLAAVKTTFGWTLQGPSQECFANKSFCLPTVLLLSLSEDEHQYSCWDLETIGIRNEEISATCTQEDFDKYVVKKDHYYEAKLLWRKDDVDIDSFREGAQSRFGNLIKKLLRDPKMLFAYESEINEMISSGIVERVGNKKGNRVYYLPHRAVYRDDKTTSKIRIVFDASAHSGNNASLNDLLSPGQNILPNVLKVLLNFRINRVGIIADISKAFLQIHLNEEDKDVHRFFWFDDKIRDVHNLPNWAEFRMTRVTFGVACSPFLLNVTIGKHLMEERSNFLQTCETLQGSFYVDDLVCSVSDESDAVKVYKESVEIMGRAGMVLHKWNSNSSTVRAEFPNAKEVSLVQKVLGVKWFVSSDELAVDITQLISGVLPETGTKRELLSLISKIFDPLGVCGPFTVKLKIAFQECWKQNLKWNDPLPPALQKVWIESVAELEYLKDIVIPRWILTSLTTGMELHIFVDASLKAYGAVAYIRYFKTDGQVGVSYLCSKNRIAPLKEDKSPELTLPKLELTAAVIGSRLWTFLKSSFKINFKSIYLWSDSQITLHWISGDVNKWKPYVANRVREIRENSVEAEWRFCSGKLNPADILTRGLSAKKLSEVPCWINGPEWLPALTDESLSSSTKVNCDTHPINTFLSVTTEYDCKGVDVKEKPILVLENFSSIHKVLRVTAYFFRFISAANNHQGADSKAIRSALFFEAKRKGIASLVAHVPIPTAEEMKAAERYWIKLIQSNSFSDELRKIRNGGAIERSSEIYGLNPVIGYDGLLRVGSRLSALNPDSEVSFDETFPIILPKDSCLAEMIINDLHHRCLHAGIGTLLAELRKRFWIARARQLVKRLTKSCVICKRIKVRAVHLELTPSLNTESCLMGIRRFIARRGVPDTFMSDNAKAFKRTSSELAVLESILESSDLKYFLSKRKISWQFIVERAPWWGGFWERLVRSVKDALKAAIGRAVLTEEQLNTFLIEVEDVINNRPLTYISDDAKDLSPLTPAHFLKVNCSNFNFENVTLVSDKDLRSRWLSRLRATKLFWKRWKLEYLNQLRSAHFSRLGSSYNAKVNDVVLVYDQCVPRLLWKIALVQRTFPGRDGKVRACELRMPNGSCLRRPVQHLYPLEVPGPAGC